MRDITEANAMMKELFDRLNKRFYNGCLPSLPICLTATTRSITAFNPDVTTVFDRKRKQDCQLNFSDDILTEPITVVCQRMLHAMCHYYCYLHDIQDVSRGNSYHNKNFRREAERHGLIQIKDGKYGWSISSPSKELAQFCVNELKDLHFGIYRYTKYEKDMVMDDDNEDTIEVRVKIKNPNSHSIKYICPCCKNSVRATKKVNIACLDCGEKMIKK